MVTADVVAPRATEALALYRTMLLIRRCEEQLVEAHRTGLIHGACHTYIGEEAVAAGVCAHLRPDDAIFSTHRGHGHALAKGVAPQAVLAELYGREGGCSGGRGGSMHLMAPEIGLLGTNGIVASSIALAAGAAYAFQLLALDRVSVAFFGDGAVNNGAFHEGLNLATVWQLPVVFVNENNLYATEMSFAQATRNTDVASRAAAYGLPGIAVDGNDVLAVSEAAGAAIARARRGGGPTLLECKTYRTRPHSEGMRDGGYRGLDEIAGWKSRDPIPRLAAFLADHGVGAAEIQAIEDEVAATVAGAHRFALESAWPDVSTVTQHVYCVGGAEEW